MSRPRATQVEYMLVVVDSFGGKHYYQKKDAEHAQTGLKHALRDAMRSPFFRDGEAWIEKREVGAWEITTSVDFRDYGSQAEEN